MTAYLLDTNVLSETRKPRPNANVLNFLDSGSNSMLYTSWIAIAELRMGAEMRSLTDSVESKLILHWIDRLEDKMQGRILVVDGLISAVYGRLQRKGDLPIMDALLAATAIAHGLVMVTRNTRDFIKMDVEILNPWTWTPPN